MLKHLFKLIWNKKKQNFLLIVEMFISFLVMFSVFTLIVYYYNNFRKPMGFEYNNLWAITYNLPGGNRNDNPDSAALLHQTIRQAIQSIPEIEDVSFTSNNIPFSPNTSNSQFEYNKISESANVYEAEDNYARVLKMPVLEGRWFSREDNGSKIHPIVINMHLKEKLFGKENPIGKVLGGDNDKMKVIGVVNDFKDKGDFQDPESGMFRRVDTGNVQYASSIIARVRDNAPADTEQRLYNTLSRSIKASNIEIEHLTAKRVRMNKLTLVPMIIFLIIAGFLITNVALGLFGVLWYNINKRRGEIGLRRAVGATGQSISFQLIGEAIVLSSLAIILGSFFAIQFPLMNVFDLPSGVYLSALALAVFFIYLLVVICALYPGKQAADIYPAVALHEE